jgi:hypothetical protein
MPFAAVIFSCWFIVFLRRFRLSRCRPDALSAYDTKLRCGEGAAGNFDRRVPLSTSPTVADKAEKKRGGTQATRRRNCGPRRGNGQAGEHVEVIQELSGGGKTIEGERPAEGGGLRHFWRKRFPVIAGAYGGLLI